MNTKIPSGSKSLYLFICKVFHYLHGTKQLVLFFVNIFFLISSHSFSQSVGIGASTLSPDTSAMLDVNGTNKGVLINRMTTVQRNAINLPANGLLIYNTDCNQFNYNGGTSLTPRWLIFAGFDAPQAISATSVSQNHFTANWNATGGAVNYHIDISLNSSFSNYVGSYNNYSVGDITSFEVTGLASGTPYYYRLRAENSCGLSGNSNTILVTTSN